MRWCLCLLLCIGYCAVMGQQPLAWHPSTSLQWNDFKAAPEPHEHNAKALCRTSLNYKYAVVGVQKYGTVVQIDISALFHPEKSWKVKHVTSDLLQHEQLHFNLTELYARKLNRAFKQELKPGTMQEVEQQIQAIFERIDAAWRAAQQRYDKQTHRGTIPKVQQHWERKTARQLQTLEKYRKRKITVVL